MNEGDKRIRRFYIFRAVTSFSLWIPFWSLWAYKNLDSLFLLTVVDAVFWSTIILFQLPAGLLGDKFGRKAVLFTGEILFSVGVLAFGLSSSFDQYLISNVIWALGVCFLISGDTPFLYDTLLELDRGADFIRIMGTANAVMFMTSAAACVVGGFIVSVTDRIELTLIIASLVAITGTFTVVFLREPKVDRRFQQSYRAQLGTGVKQVLKSKPIMVLILFQIVLELGIYVMMIFRSVYMNVQLRLSFLEIGLFFASFAIVGGLFTRLAGTIEGWLKEKRALLFMFVTMIFSFAVVFLVRSSVAVSTQYLMYIITGLQAPIINGYINRLVDSSHRSTIMGIASMMFTIMVVIVEVSIGWIASIWGLEESLLILALAVTPVGILLLYFWNKEVDKFMRKPVKLSAPQE
ncbi:MAG: MFS transporter [Candidatus Thermoplasmatota archaeon]|nr:MFS transporter [Candidatus Thermoplasmatota archaeon]